MNFRLYTRSGLALVFICNDPLSPPEYIDSSVRTKPRKRYTYPIGIDSQPTDKSLIVELGLQTGFLSWLEQGQKLPNLECVYEWWKSFIKKECTHIQMPSDYASHLMVINVCNDDVITQHVRVTGSGFNLREREYRNVDKDIGTDPMILDNNVDILALRHDTLDIITGKILF